MAQARLPRMFSWLCAVWRGPRVSRCWRRPPPWHAPPLHLAYCSPGRTARRVAARLMTPQQRQPETDLRCRPLADACQSAPSLGARRCSRRARRHAPRRCFLPSSGESAMHKQRHTRPHVPRCRWQLAMRGQETAPAAGVGRHGLAVRRRCVHQLTSSPT